MFTLIENGEVYAPEYRGKTSVLAVAGKILKVGNIDPTRIKGLDDECEIVDARGCYVIPGLVDPHEHLIGAGGEQGFASRVPEISYEELVRAGITTAVGCLGTDTTTRNLTSLFGSVRELQAKGLSAFMYTGGFQVPTPTITSSVREDLVLLDPVIGVGEIAISDKRSVEPTEEELAKLVSNAYIGGLVGGKAGVTHFHVGEGKRGLGLLNSLLDHYDLPPECLYPAHTNRTRKLIDQAISFAARGAFVDMDTTEKGLGQWLRYYLDKGGDPAKLTVSSDSHTSGATPAKHYQEFLGAIKDYNFSLEEALPFFTTNPAKVLKLARKGCIEPNFDADLAILDQKSMELRHLLARGTILLKNGKVTVC